VKTFKVTVDGQSYTVSVEEVAEDSKQEVKSSVNPPAVKSSPAPVPAAVEKPKEEVKVEKSIAPGPVNSEGSAVNAPMPGSVLDVKVAVGDSVNEGDVLLVLEAMKMENELTAPQAGKVSQVMVKKGDAVNSGDPLVVLN
jgi:glutaconyl-CoA decarboxylase